MTDDVGDAVQAVLNDDHKAYDPNQVMGQAPYGYDMPGKMCGFLVRVKDKLAACEPPWDFDKTKLDPAKCIGETVVQLQTDIEEATT